MSAMLPSALKKSESKDEKETKCVTFSREDSFKDKSEHEGLPTVAASKVEKDSMEQVDEVDEVDAMIDDLGILHQDEAAECSLKARKGKKVVPTDSMKRNRERFSKNLED